MTGKDPISKSDREQPGLDEMCLQWPWKNYKGFRFNRGKIKKKRGFNFVKPEE